MRIGKYLSYQKIVLYKYNRVCVRYKFTQRVLFYKQNSYFCTNNHILTTFKDIKL